ncbi:hypothetical protein [Paenibacillus taiwanensis]|uniref:hypothetical protein n=1 Tax=Paenibacillus taiwanensis TaxID=401638 RepID=UPI00040B53A1|nr:hypothetical protein [Paenibacillus taiwanensis]
MKKFVMGLIVGALFMFSAQAFGTSSKLVGLEVGGTMDVNLQGKKIGEAAVIEGKSYLPVRDLANGLQMEVKVENKIIKLEPNDELKEFNRQRTEELAQKAKEDQEKAEKEAANKNRITTLNAEIKELKNRITDKTEQLTKNEFIVANLKKSDDRDSYYYHDTDNTPYVFTTSSLEKFKVTMQDMKKDIEVLQAEVKKLEAELAELQK